MYASYYGFSELPFQITPDSRFFFGHGPHKKALAYASYGLNKAEGFVVITGEIGAGKTTLVNYLLSQLSGSDRRTANIVSTNLENDSLLRVTANAFGIDCDRDEKAVLLQKIQQFLSGQSAGADCGLLVVDEIQNLPASSLEELRMLSNFQKGHKALLQIFLVGQPEFREVLIQPSMEQLRQRVVASFHLGALDEGQTWEYIEYRLRKVGWRDDPRIDPICSREIFRASGGIPRRINLICDRLLISAFLAESHEIGLHDVSEVIFELRQEKLIPASAQPQPQEIPKKPVNQAPQTRKGPTFTPNAANASGQEFQAISHRLKELDRVMRDQEQRIDQILADGLLTVSKSG